MFGPAASALKITLNEDYGGFLLAILPPGAFFGLALLIVAKNLIEQRFISTAIALTEKPASA